MLWLERGGPANLMYDEIDGIELAMEWIIEVYFIPSN
jgi:hypothetical protein